MAGPFSSSRWPCRQRFDPLMVTLENRRGVDSLARTALEANGNILRERRAIGFFDTVFLCYCCAIYGPISTCFPMMAEAKYHASSSRIDFVFSFKQPSVPAARRPQNFRLLNTKWSFRALISLAGLCYTSSFFWPPFGFCGFARCLCLFPVRRRGFHLPSSQR